ncbi:hypothetical protein I7I50_09343 [Histoplasma capsulatum G186AR]|uniref:Uncharacterized protein n=1 Tax=Ajellomyces capsulatus TaxID=5037 RepID=A0A8H7YU99_AJECA|nr:hypothetical protein I7I52_06864 [Histoplasma capsulatum]QSS74244.1 hypothetical protein I7I50_09343 [Histoplasma capsulatum G186AR]
MVFKAVGPESAVFFPLLSGATCVNIQFLKARFLPSFSSSPGLLIARASTNFYTYISFYTSSKYRRRRKTRPWIGDTYYKQKIYLPRLTGCEHF